MSRRPKGQTLLSSMYCVTASTFFCPACSGGAHTDFKLRTDGWEQPPLSHGPARSLLCSPLPRLLASCGALSLASLHVVVVRPGLLLLRSPRQLVTLGQQHHPLLRAAFGPWPTEPSSYSKTRHVNWALKKGRFLSASYAPGGVLRDSSALSHYSLITI